MIRFSPYGSISACRWAPNVSALITNALPSTAGTISGEEVPIVSKTNIKEYRDSFSCEKFTFRSNPNITFYVYVSNFSWPIKIQVRIILFQDMYPRFSRVTWAISNIESENSRLYDAGWFQVHFILMTRLIGAGYWVWAHRCF